MVKNKFLFKNFAIYLSFPSFLSNIILIIQDITDRN